MRIFEHGLQRNEVFLLLFFQKKKTLPFLIAVALAAWPSLAAADDPGLPKNVADAQRIEAADALKLTGFFDTPANLGRTQPGDLLRSEEGAGYSVPAGVRVVRFLYHSRNSRGEDVASSGVVLVPPGTAPREGWKVIVWAHGTSGVARQCAPSLAKDVTYGEEGLFPMVRAGFAVVAPDYHGLGTEGPHEYLNKIAQTYDVIYAVPAARKAVPALGARWVVDGHSQGGRAAWGVAEAETRLNDPNYLGAVSVAGAAELGDFMLSLQRAGALQFYQDYIAFGIKAVTPGFDPASLLTGAALAHYRDLAANGCWDYAYARFLDQSGPLPYRQEPGAHAAVTRWLAESRFGETRLNKPLLVIAGEADQTEIFARVRPKVAKVCAAGIRVQFRAYKALDHDPTMQNSTPDQLNWINDRFAGRGFTPC